jgi:hypothetical protein
MGFSINPKKFIELIKELSRSGAAIQFYLASGPDMHDPLDIVHTLTYRLRQNYTDIAFGRGVKLLGPEPNGDELDILLDSIISTVKEKCA